jgi:deazaflavin-dependent oxidoreductase (nitroreductase family)
MTETTMSVQDWLTHWAGTPFAYLTTIGRRSGQPHLIEIWFAVENERLYLMSGGRDRSDWVRNLQANPLVMIELGGETRAGMARTVPEGTAEDQRVRELLVGKYATPSNPLEDWKRRSLAVAVEFSTDTSEARPHASNDAR